MKEKFFRMVRNIGGAICAIGFGVFTIIGDLVYFIGTCISWVGCGLNKIAMFLLSMADAAFDKRDSSAPEEDGKPYDPLNVEE